MMTRSKTLTSRVHPEEDICENIPSLNGVALAIEEMTENLIINNIYDADKFNNIYRQIYNFVNPDMSPTFDDINDMLKIARSLLEVQRHKNMYAEFILSCPHKFLMTYSNNSERTPQVLERLKKLDLPKVRNYLISHIHSNKLNTWYERGHSYETTHKIVDGDKPRYVTVTTKEIYDFKLECNIM